MTIIYKGIDSLRRNSLNNRLKELKYGQDLIIGGISFQNRVDFTCMDFLACIDKSSYGATVRWDARVSRIGRLMDGVRSKWWAMLEIGSKLFLSLKMNLAVSNWKVWSRSRSLRCSKIGLVLTWPKGANDIILTVLLISVFRGFKDSEDAFLQLKIPYLTYIRIN